jgi:undecaprenyl-diphosphatase
LVDCGGSYGFPSSHASNHFGLAIFSGITLQKNYKWIWFAGLFWAVLVSYAQIYVGVHYPLDVAFGACIGLFAGVASSWVMKKTVALDMQVSTINTQ